MTEQEWIRKIKREGYEDVGVCPINTKGVMSEPHTHYEHTVHVVIEGELTMVDNKGTVTLREGARVEIPKGTTHTIKTNPEGCKLLVGVKEK